MGKIANVLRWQKLLETLFISRNKYNVNNNIIFIRLYEKFDCF